MVLWTDMSANRDLKIAVVCSSNMNRSMEAHNLLSKKGFDVKSFGTGTHVKLPGPHPNQPNVYSFDTPYEQIYRDLTQRDRQLYTQNGMLHMLDRNRRIKKTPERFHDSPDQFDLVITVEERVFDAVVEELGRREPESYTPVHVINMDVTDNAEEATLGAFQILEICDELGKLEDLENEIDDVLQRIEKKSQRHLLHSVAFY